MLRAIGRAGGRLRSDQRGWQVPAGIAAAVVLGHVVYWAAIGDILGSDRAHVFLVGCGGPDLQASFNYEPLDRYRPLAMWLEGALTCLYARDSWFGFPAVVLFIAAANGLAAALIYLIARRLHGSAAVAGLAVFLFLFSTSAVVSNLTILFSMFQLGPLLATLLVVYGYLRYRDGGHAGWLALVVVAGIAGPWLREAGVLGAAAVTALELLRLPKTRSPFVLLTLALLLHGLYPSALPKALGVYDYDVVFIFGTQEIGSNFEGNLVNWWRAGRTANELPPLLWLLTAASASLFAARLAGGGPGGIRYWYRALTGSGASPAERVSGFGGRPRAVAAGLLLMLFAVIAYATLFTPAPPEATSFSWRLELALIAYVVVLMGLTALRFGALLPLWFLALFLPLLRQPTNYETHLPFIVAPLCMIAALWLHQLWLEARALAARRPSARGIQFALAAVLLVGLMDQARNVVAAYVTNVTMARSTQAMADLMRQQMPDQSLLFVNSFPAFEVFGRGGEVWETRWITRVGPISHAPGHEVLHAYDEQVERIKAATDSGRDVYYLLVTSANADGTYFVPPLGLDSMAEWTVTVPHYAVDPLRYFMTKPAYAQYFGPFQWRPTFEQFDRSRSVARWDARFVLYRLDATAVPEVLVRAGASASGGHSAQPELVVDGYESSNYNIIAFAGKYYGLHRGDGAFSIEGVRAGTYAQPVYVGDSAEAVMRLIDTALAPVVPQGVTELVFDGFRGGAYNVVAVDGQYYGTHRGNGPFELEKVRDGSYPYPVLVADSLGELARLIDEASGEEAAEASGRATLVADGYRGRAYRILEFEERYYASPASTAAGAADADAAAIARGEFDGLTADSLDAVTLEIDRVEGLSALTRPRASTSAGP